LEEANSRGTAVVLKPLAILFAQACCWADRMSIFPRLATYSTPSSAGGATAVGGEKRRLAIARMLLHDPRILIWARPLRAGHGKVRWCCEDGDVMADGSVRERKPLPA